jgi:hypothetical protein
MNERLIHATFSEPPVVSGTMKRKTFIGLAAAIAVAVGMLGAATPGNALACSGGLGENCAKVEQDGVTPSGLTVKVDLPGLSAPSEPKAGVEMAAGGCGAAAAQAAARSGGQVIGSPKAIKKGNRTMCVVTVLIKDPKGKKPPTRKQVTVPAN